jgi:hypothetical protein
MVYLWISSVDLEETDDETAVIGWSYFEPKVTVFENES